MLAGRTCELRMETLRSKAVFEATLFRKYLELNHRGRIELRARKDKRRGSLCCAVIHRSAVVGAVPPKILAACVLFLRRNQLRLVLFNTLVESCHEKIGHNMLPCMLLFHGISSNVETERLGGALLLLMTHTVILTAGSKMIS